MSIEYFPDKVEEGQHRVLVLYHQHQLVTHEPNTRDTLNTPAVLHDHVTLIPTYTKRLALHDRKEDNG